MTTKAKKPRNATDATNRNVRASKKRDTGQNARIAALTTRIGRLEARVGNLAKVIGRLVHDSLPKRHVYTMGKAAKRR